MEVRVGPVGGTSLVWRDLHMEAEIEIDRGSKPNKSKVKIWNLSAASRAFCESSGQVIQVLAGDGVPSQLCLMDIVARQVSTARSGPDVVTTIEARDGLRRWHESIFARSYPQGTARSVILADILAELRLPIGYQSPSIAPFVYSGGYSFVGKAVDALAEVMAMDLSSWTIQAGAIYLFALHDPGMPGAPLLSEETGLMESPVRKDKGAIECKARLQPAFSRAGMGMTIKSRWINGVFKVAKVRHHCTSDGQTWETSITADPVKA
jgi:hypothetical protein